MARQGKKIPESIWDKFLILLSEHTTSVSSTCRALNIEARSYYNKRSKDKNFGDIVDEIFDQVRRPFAEDALFTLIAERNLGAIKFYLNQRGGKRWNDSKIIPLIVRNEIENPPPKPEFKQGVPSIPDMLVSIVYRKAQELDPDNIPETLTLDLSKIKDRLDNPQYKKRMIQDNPELYGSDSKNCQLDKTAI